MKTTSSIRFYCRDIKTDKRGLAPIEVSIIINGKRCFISLPTKEYPSKFKKDIESRRNNTTKEYCEEIRTKLRQYEVQLLQNGLPITADNLKTVFKTGGVQSYTVERLFKDYLALLKKRVGIDLTSGAYRKYELTTELFFKHGQLDKNDEVSKITPSVIRDFYITLQKEYSTNSAASYIAKTKTFIQYGLDNAKIKINPFQSLKVKREKKKIDYLSAEELNKLKETPIENDCLNDVRNAFLLQCYSGLSYIDLEHLSPSDIKVSDNNIYYIQKERIKTKQPYTAVILPHGVQLLKNNSIRVISNQKMNLYLKQVMVLCGITHPLTTHLGRKTYGHILLNSGVRMETVAKALGHSNSKTTAKYYAEVESNTVIQEIVQSL